jgi:hypothetical protein
MLSLPLILIYPFREGLYIMKTQTIPFKSFIQGDWKQKSNEGKTVIEILIISGTIVAVTIPKIVLANDGMDGAFGNVHKAIMRGFDAGVVLVIIFAGAAWGLGHRSKAIEILIGVSCGYILARHAVDIRDFLRGI